MKKEIEHTDAQLEGNGFWLSKIIFKEITKDYEKELIKEEFMQKIICLVEMMIKESRKCTH